jgi:hypothetical protein
MAQRMEGSDIKTPNQMREFKDDSSNKSWGLLGRRGFQEPLELQKTNLVVNRRWRGMTSVRRKLEIDQALEQVSQRQLRKRIEMLLGTLIFR